MNSISFGLKTAPQHTTYAAMLRVWKEADANRAFEHAWLFDHFAPIYSDLEGACFEAWTLLAALAAQTRRLRLGIMVTGNTYRHPAVLAKMAATVDVISNGRLDLGLGAGWNEYEHRSMGIPLYPPGERIRRLGEACEILKSLFTNDLTTYDGRYYQLAEARCEPKPLQEPHPPLVIGGSGEQLTLRVAAQHADIWNYPGNIGEADVLARKVQVLRGHCERVGRDPADITISVQPRVNYENLEETRGAVERAVAAGATHIVLILNPPYPDGIVDRLAGEIVQRVKG